MQTSLSQTYEQEKKYHIKRQLLETKPIESYPDYIKNELKIISMIPGELSTPFGSYIYRMQPFAGDIDTLQHIHYVNEETTIFLFIKQLQKVVRSLNKNHVYSEVKAGINYNFIFPIGTLQNGNFLIDEQLVDTLGKKYHYGLFTDKEYNTMITALGLVKSTDDKKIHSMAYDYVFDLIRNKKVLRWSKDDILKGFIMISGEKYTLIEAISDETMTKIDVISYINNRFVEVTNIMFLAYPETDENGDIKYIPINVSEEALHARGLSHDIEKLYYSNKFYSPFKACKRIYAEMRRLKYYQFLEQLSPIIRHEISLLYQIKSEIDACVIVLEKTTDSYYFNLINHQLQEIKGRLNYVLDITQEQIKDFSKDIDTICMYGIREVKHKKLDELSNSLKSIIEFLTIASMNKHNFNPFPSVFLPIEMSYDANIVRAPTDNPTKIYKEFVKLLSK
jgi:hypothetical protein